MILQERVILVIEFLYCALDIILLEYYCSLFLDSMQSRKKTILINFIATSLIYFITTATTYSSIITILSLLTMLIYGRLSFSGKGLIVFSSVGLYFAISGLASLLITILIPIFTSYESIDVFSSLFLRLFIVLITKLTVFGVGYLIQKKKDVHSSALRNFKSLLCFSIIIVIVLILIFEFVFLTGSLQVQDLVIVMSLVFVCGVAFVGFLISRYYISRDTNLVLSLRLHDANLKNQLYIQSTNEQIEIMKVKHDIKNHLITLEGLIKQNLNEEASTYLKTLHSYPGLKTYISSKNKAINAILNQKISENLDINFKIRHDDGEFKLPSDKLTIILGNALDNAIQAVKNLEVVRKNIKVVISENKFFIKIFISNYFDKMPVIINNKLISQKTTQFSGLGMINIYEAVKSLQGQVNYEIINNSVFELSILVDKQQNNH